jgi:hypothetical protein
MTFPITVVICYVAAAAFGVLPPLWAAFCAVQSLLGYAAGRLAQKASA